MKLTENQVEELLADRFPEDNCATCSEIRIKYNGFGPSHNGSKLCESGSIASGGKNAHCTCDWCF